VIGDAPAGTPPVIANPGHAKMSFSFFLIETQLLILQPEAHS